MEGINREGSMWEIMNVISPIGKRNLRDNYPDYVLPIADKRINTIFPSVPKKEESQKIKKVSK